MKVCRSGTTVYSAASSRARSGPGSTAGSAPRAVTPAVVGLTERSLSPAGVGLREPVGEQLARVGGPRGFAVRRPPLGDGPLERRQSLARDRVGVAAEEAGALTRVTGRAGRVDERDHGVAIAVDAKRVYPLDVARGLALVPELAARAAEQMDLARRPCALERLGVHVREREHLASRGVLDHARD